MVGLPVPVQLLKDRYLVERAAKRYFILADMAVADVSFINL